MKSSLLTMIFAFTVGYLNAVATELATGPIVLVDPHTDTITIETITGLKEYEVDADNIIIEEDGPLVGYEQEPSLKSLMLGDIVTVIEQSDGAGPERKKLERIRRSRPSQ